MAHVETMVRVLKSLASTMDTGGCMNMISRATVSMDGMARSVKTFPAMLRINVGTGVRAKIDMIMITA